MDHLFVIWVRSESTWVGGGHECSLDLSAANFIMINKRQNPFYRHSSPTLSSRHGCRYYHGSFRICRLSQLSEVQRIRPHPCAKVPNIISGDSCRNNSLPFVRLSSGQIFGYQLPDSLGHDQHHQQVAMIVFLVFLIDWNLACCLLSVVWAFCFILYLCSLHYLELKLAISLAGTQK